jgi:putative MATE family efflux protein
MALGMVFQAIPAAVTAVLRGRGDSTGPMRYNIITNLVNAAVGLLLIHGFWGLPALGLTGAAIATTFAKIVNTALALDALRRNGRAVAEEPVTVHPGRLPPPDMAIIRRIFRVGNSAAVESLAMRAGFIFYSRIIADLGILAFAAHQIILSVTQFVSNTMQGLSAAASSYTGWGLGAGEPQVARRHNRVLLHYGFLVSVVMGGLFFFFGTAIAALFSSDAAVVTLSGSILRIAGVITVPQCFLAILSGALRGAGDTKWPMYGAFAGVVIARVGLAYILVVPLGMGLYGAWLAALADQCIRAVFTTVRYGRGRWTQLYV